MFLANLNSPFNTISFLFLFSPTNKSHYHDEWLVSKFLAPIGDYCTAGPSELAGHTEKHVGLQLVSTVEILGFVL